MSFYDSPEWLRLRYFALSQSGGVCEACKRRPTIDNPLHCDHILPRSHFSELELDADNVQILCRECNLGKGNHDLTDWRSPSCTSER
jgi:5-methylcytosine-specific restriction endonuclease McrA